MTRGSGFRKQGGAIRSRRFVPAPHECRPALPDQEPNSRRFWRLNSIAGLRMVLGSLSATSYAADPETLATHRAHERQLAELLRREAAVQARARRWHGLTL